MAEEPKPVTEKEVEKVEALFNKWCAEPEDSILEEIFALCDRDGNGYVEKAEVMEMQKAALGEANE